MGDGSSVLFWDDQWTNQTLSEQYPRLLSFTKNPRISVKEVFDAEELESLFFRPLSQGAFDELGHLWTDLQDF